MLGAIKERLSEFQKLSCISDAGKEQKHMTKKIHLTQIEEEIVMANVTDTEGKLKQITNHVKTWETLSFEDRQAVVDALIKVIKIADGNIEITWNF